MEVEVEVMRSKPRILLLASPGMGHLIPLIELSKRLVSFETLDITLFFISTHTSTSQTQLLKSSSEFHNDLHLIDLTPVNASDYLSTTSCVETRLLTIVKESLAALKSQISCMKPPPQALIVDIFGAAAFDLADEFRIPKYMFVTSTAWLVALMIYSPTLDAAVEGEYVDATQPVQIPGCKPIRPSDVVDPMLDRNGTGYQLYIELCTQMVRANGILMNTWEDLEPRSLIALREDSILRQIMKPRVYPIGPVVRTAGPEVASGDECLDWLTMQPSGSVLYVSFGSGGTMSAEQMTELAWGLELSQQRFIWVIRPPISSSDAAGSFFDSGAKGNDPVDYLPQGFLTRTLRQGIVVTGWVPQEYVLAHPSVGAFVSHCGWNSTMESITNGVPMIAWPLYAEQRMNAEMLAVDLGVAVRPELLPTKGIVRRDEIEKMVRLVLVSREGKIIKEKVKEIREGATKAIGKGGSSNASLLQLVKECGG